jgi:hypothetical protein
MRSVLVVFLLSHLQLGCLIRYEGDVSDHMF